MSIADLFAPKLPGARAQDAFADRKDEQVAFDDAFAAYCADLDGLRDGDWSAQDLGRARRNVLSFYGIGGVGKSALLERIEDRLGSGERQPNHWSPPPPGRPTAVLARVDLSTLSGNSVEGVILALRVALQRAGMRATALDLFLSVYWPAVHPHDRLEDHPAVQGLAGRISAQLGINDHIESVASDVLGAMTGISTIGMTAVRVTDQILRAARDHRFERSALASCSLLPELLSAPMDADAIAFGAHVLAWDLQLEQSRADRPVVVLLDTMEDLSESVDIQLERLVWLLPNVLFVIAGRNRIRWDGNSRGVPVLPGRVLNWECLAEERSVEPRAHLVGHLSDTDARTFLESRLGAHAASAVVAQIVRSTEGFPLHLDLSIQRFLQISATRRPLPSDFKASFDELAVRVLRDLSTRERGALLACCLFDSFDEDLIQVTAGLENVGPVRGLFRRSLVTDSELSVLGRSLHNVLRTSFLTAAELGESQLSDADWKLLAQRGFDEVVRRGKAASGQRLDFFASAAASIALTFEIDARGLPELLQRLAESTQWSAGWAPSALPGRRAIAGSSSAWAPLLIAGARIVMSRQEIPRQRVAEELRRVLAGTKNAVRELDMLRYFHAEALRDVGDVRASERVMSAIFEGRSAYTSRAIHNAIHLHRRAGRFVTVQEMLRRHRNELEYAHRLEGDLFWTQARFTEARDAYVRALDKARDLAAPGEIATCLTSIAFVDAWSGTAKVDENLAASRDVLGGEFHSFSYLLGLVAESIAAAGLPQGRDRVANARREAVRLQQTSLEAYADLADGFDLAVRGDEPRLEVLGKRLHRRARDSGQFGYVARIVQTWAGQDSEQALEDWLPGNPLAAWSALVSERSTNG